MFASVRLVVRRRCEETMFEGESKDVCNDVRSVHCVVHEAYRSVLCDREGWCRIVE
jgi:hypothetical protein